MQYAALNKFTKKCLFLIFKCYLRTAKYPYICKNKMQTNLIIFALRNILFASYYIWRIINLLVVYNYRTWSLVIKLWSKLHDSSQPGQRPKGVTRMPHRISRQRDREPFLTAALGPLACNRAMWLGQSFLATALGPESVL